MTIPDTRAFYDGLADDFHLIYGDWNASIGRQGEALDRVIRQELGPGRKRILDCTCGIGTQSLGLAAAGHDVVGTDLSPRAIRRAREEAGRRGLPIRFEVADVRSLEEVVSGDFDVVISADNSLPHLETEADLRRGIRRMLASARSGGLLLASIRDYDALLKEKPVAMQLGLRGGKGERTVSFQLWTWQPDGRSYDLELFLVREGQDEWRVSRHEARYRAITRDELSAILRDEGAPDARWLMPDESGFFQPLVVARKT